MACQYCLFSGDRICHYVAFCQRRKAVFLCISVKKRRAGEIGKTSDLFLAAV